MFWYNSDTKPYNQIAYNLCIWNDKKFYISYEPLNGTLKFFCAAFQNTCDINLGLLLYMTSCPNNITMRRHYNLCGDIIYILRKNIIVRRTIIPHFLDFSAYAVFFGIWRSAGAFFALSAMRAHFFYFFSIYFVK